MSIVTAHTSAVGLPWELAPAETARLRGWIRICGTVALLAGLVMPWLPLPDEASFPAPAVLPATPIQLSLEQPRRVPPLPPAIPLTMPVLPPAAKESLAAKETPAANPATVAKPDPTPGARAESEPQAADGSPAPADPRAVAATAGLFAASSALGGLRGAVDARKLASSGSRATGVGTQATVDRALLTSHFGTRSAGVNEGALSQGTGGVALAGRATTRVGIPGGTGTGGGSATGGASAGAGGAGSGAGGIANGTGSGTGQRSIEDIRRVFDANKGAIFAIYHRALRAAPGLRGEVVLELVIAPGGAVTEIRVVSSELDDQELLDRLLGRIRLFDFGAREVVQTRISYPVHFLPG